MVEQLCRSRAGFTLAMVGVAAGMACAALVGCAPRSSQPPLGFADFLRDLTNTVELARLDCADTRLVSSGDRTGGNTDYNNFLRKGPTGWVVLAELRGPGYVSRFWFTGGESSHRVRIFFDGERKARIDTTVGTLCGGMAPFLPPLAEYKNYCFYSFVPLPYAKSIRIEMQEGELKASGQTRLFYQIAYRTLTGGRTTLSFPVTLTPDELSAVEQVRKTWTDGLLLPPGLPPATSTQLVLAPGSNASNIIQLSGPAVIRSVQIQPDFDGLETVAERERVLRDMLLSIRWDGSTAASVQVPLGDFFGSVWRRTRYESMFFGLSNSTFSCRFPMPFKTAAAIGLENQGTTPVRVTLSVEAEPLPTWDARLGYFHAGWYRTSPGDVGSPHPILHATGKGKYVGCILGVVCADRTFWLLEGNESIRKDAETTQAWYGTGLEDYFNGGWYYQNVLAEPTHGVPIKAPFRTVQYRVHLMDPSLFDQSFDMVFERGPNQQSHGWMESTAFYYMAQPTPAFSRLGTAQDRVAPRDPMEQATVMTDIWNYERLHDYAGASEYIDGFIAIYPAFPFVDLLRLRQVAYVEKMKGFDAARPLYEGTLQTSTNAVVRQYTETLLWAHESTSNALMGVYCDTRTHAYIDGRDMGSAENPEQMMIWKLQLAPGRHVLALAARYKAYPDWVQLCLRTQHGDVTTDPTWKTAFNPSGNWKGLDYDDSGWQAVGGTGVKGPPEEPYVWVFPDPFVDMQSKAIGLRPMQEWPGSKEGIVVYRKSFTMPTAGQ